ncbi:MAG: PAS domain S-box protein [Verrucomicrobia bacterium]|nr:PAS domain S-box protein [Verrucomicrobiota bacterium]
MPQPIKILVVEDRAADAELLVRELQRAGFAPEWTVVETEAAYLAALHPGLDLVFSDYALPAFSGTRALALLQERVTSVPFILVSGTIGEETAVNAMKLGAADYLLKDRLGRLGPAVMRALSQGRLRRERLAAEVAAARTEAKYRSIFEHSVEGLYQTTVEGRLVIANPMLARIAGYGSAGEMIAEVTDVGEQFYVDPEDRRRFQAAIQADGMVRGFEAQMRRRGGELVWISSDARVIRDEAGNLGFEGALRDITER